MAKNYAFIGLFGSGKTEVAINWALGLKKELEKVAIIDGDIISPYFRTRDVAEELEKMGLVTVYPKGALRNADLPIITGGAIGYLSNPEYKTVLDVGGEENGIVVLGYLKPYLGDAEISMVVNIARPFSSTVDGIINAYEQLRRVVGIKVDYLINNANLSYETTSELILRGEEMVGKVSELIEVPVKFTVVPDFIDDDENKFRYPIFKIKRFMRMEI
ncbi:MAG TPA: cobalamin biosynthesis protein CobQ [Fervidobacterium sp.]|nr:cobalamin biosynthesis protein CobQ [Fervidobacterium sp.]